MYRYQSIAYVYTVLIPYADSEYLAKLPKPINSFQTQSFAFKNKLGSQQTNICILSEAILEQIDLPTQRAQTSSNQVSAPFLTL